MLSPEDFNRLISDPRLGRVKRFFHPVQHLDDIEDAQENRWKPCNLVVTDVDICYETSSEDTQPCWTITSTSEKKTKPKRCNSCLHCMAKDCGRCIQCLDKPRFGGRGIRKQGCALRKRCQLHTSKVSERLACPGTK